jgi:hypothetical protein
MHGAFDPKSGWKNPENMRTLPLEQKQNRGHYQGEELWEHRAELLRLFPKLKTVIDQTSTRLIRIQGEKKKCKGCTFARTVKSFVQEALMAISSADLTEEDLPFLDLNRTVAISGQVRKLKDIL